MSKLEIQNFAEVAETRTFELGKFELVRVGDMVLGRATYEPGWIWSEHVGKPLGKTSCDVEHVGVVLSGAVAVKMDDGREVVMGPGVVFEVGPGHDSWVVGDEPYVSLHLLGADEYAT